MLASLFRREMRETRAVDDISFAIEQSQIVGFLGPNGAGKTTTLKQDVVSQQRVRDVLRQLNRAYGTTILLISHYMDDIEQLCPRVLVIDHGQLRFDGTLAALVERAAPHKRVVAVFAKPVARE